MMFVTPREHSSRRVGILFLLGGHDHRDPSAVSGLQNIYGRHPWANTL